MAMGNAYVLRCGPRMTFRVPASSLGMSEMSGSLARLPG